MLDITASSVEMVGKPKEIFKDLNKGHTSTRYMFDYGKSPKFLYVPLSVLRSNYIKGKI